MAKKEIPNVYMDKLLRDLEGEQTHWAVSFEDLRKHDSYIDWSRKHFSSSNKELFGVINSEERVLVSYPKPPKRFLETLLSDLGLDVSEHYDEQVCKHRTWSGEVVDTVRYVGCQRTDLKWVNFKKKVVS